MPRRKGGLFLPLDVNFMDDPKVVRAGEAAGWLYLSMCLACKRLGVDGNLEELQIDRLHISGWRKRLDKLIASDLVVDLGEGHYAIRAWYGHNDPAHVVEARKAADSARKKTPRPNGFRTDSIPSRDVEQNRVEKNRTAVRPDAVPQQHVPCPHGADHSGLCALCRAVAGDA